MPNYLNVNKLIAKIISANTVLLRFPEGPCTSFK